MAPLGIWKGYESKCHLGIITLWMGLTYFKSASEGCEIRRNVTHTTGLTRRKVRLSSLTNYIIQNYVLFVEN